MNEKKILVGLANLLSMLSCGENTPSQSKFEAVELLSCGSTAVDKVITKVSEKLASLTGNKITLKKINMVVKMLVVVLEKKKIMLDMIYDFYQKKLNLLKKELLSDKNVIGTIVKPFVSIINLILK